MKQVNTGATDNTPVRVPRWAYSVVTMASLFLGIEAIVRGTSAVHVIGDSDLTNFFFKSATYILNGDPWHMYAVRASGAYPNYNPPLSIALMAPLLALAHAIGFDKNFGELITFVCIPFMVFVPFLGYLVLRALRQLYPEIPEAQQFLAYALVVLSPLTWQSYGTWYHIEQPMMLCFLVGAVYAFQQRRETLAGLLAGLALMTRTTALIPLIALGILLIMSGEWRALIKLAGMAALVVVVVLGPFFLTDRADTTYSFLSWRGTAEIGGNSIWSIFAASNTATGMRHTLDAFARRLDMPTVILFVAVVTFLAFRRWRISAYGRDAWAVLAIAALAVPMLSKTNWPYYYLEPFILLLIWEFTSLHDRRAGVWRWPVLSITFLAASATLSQYIGLQSVGTLDRIGVGLLEFTVMLAFVILIWLRLQAAKPAAAQRMTHFNAPPPIAFQVATMPPAPQTPSPQRGMPTPPRAGVGAPPQRGLPSPQQLVSSPLEQRNQSPAPATPEWPTSPPSSASQQQAQPTPNWPDLSAAPGPQSGGLSNPAQFSSPQSTQPPASNPVNMSGAVLHETPHWQEGNSLPLPDQWPDLNNATSGWPSLSSQSPQPEQPPQWPPKPSGQAW